MCSIGVSNTSKSLKTSNQFSKYRGPDRTNIVDINGVQFLHNLLHLTGELTIQPFIKDDVAVVFNGEIYNYKDFGDYKTDGEVLIDLYKEHGIEFIKLLDGEFAICLIDFKNELILISTDPFACKPLWYDFKDEEFCIASYNSQLSQLGFSNGTKLYANTTLVFDLKSYELKDKITNFDFNIKQYKNTYDDWIRAFEKSIEKRVQSKYKIYLGLSSGYDSGAIACELLNQNVDFKTYTIAGPEDKGIIESRVERIPNHEVIYMTRKEYDTEQKYLNETCEDFSYGGYNFKGDKASVGLSHICSKASQEGYRIYLSGQGADEIISDYGFQGNKIYNHSQFGGLFPSNLTGFWPWVSFYDGTQIQYLNKEEYVAGHYGIETRYPFLDKYLVQEFLWLDSTLKNSKYKSSLDEYLRRNDFPFSSGHKIGFNTLKDLR